MIYHHEILVENWQGKKAVRHNSLLLHKLAEKLKRVKARQVVINNNRVGFKGLIFSFVPSMNLLATVTSGYIELRYSGNNLVISYGLNFKGLLLMSIAVVLFFAIIIFISGDVHNPKALLVLLVFWLVSFLGNFLQTILRFYWFVKNAVDDE